MNVPIDAGPRDPAKRGGVGVRIERRGTELVVIGVVPNSPCQRAGVQVGDVLVRIDGRMASAADIQGSNIRGVPGPAGTAVVLTWRRGIAERTTRLIRVDWAVLFPGG